MPAPILMDPLATDSAAEARCCAGPGRWSRSS